jgi:hypothetical protein
MHPQHLDRAIAATAARQEGVIGRDQLAALPLSHTAIAKRIAAGRLHPVFPGAYSVGVPARSTAAIRVAALLSTAPSYISHRDAAEEHGLVDPIPGPIHVTVAHGRRLRRDGIVIHRTRHLHRDERVTRGPLRMTSPARTLVDIAGGMTRQRLSASFDEGIRIGAFTADQVEAACRRSNGRPGTGALLALVREAHLPFERTRSPPEARFLRFCADQGLPIPLVNVPLLGFEVDFLWPTQKLVVEIDSSHHDSPRARAADAARDAELGAAGFHVERIRPRRLATAPGALAARLRALIAGGSGA